MRIGQLKSRAVLDKNEMAIQRKLNTGPENVQFNALVLPEKVFILPLYLKLGLIK